MPRHLVLPGLAALALAALAATAPRAEEPTAPKPSNLDLKLNDDGRYVDANGDPTYRISPDGTIDWATFSGFRRYHAECHTCHGPEGLGSSYAPSLVESLHKLSYADFQMVIVNGRQNLSAGQNRVMPALGENLNVMCYLDDIYTYLKARSDGALPRGRPEKREPKPEPVAAAEKVCFGGK